MDMSELQQQNYLDGRRRYEETHGKTIAEMDAELERKLAPQRAQPVEAGSSRVDRLLKTIADMERKRGKAPAADSVPVPSTPAPPSPILRATAAFAEALRRIRQGDIAEALAPNGNHKLPPHIAYG